MEVSVNIVFEFVVGYVTFFISIEGGGSRLGFSLVYFGKVLLVVLLFDFEVDNV